MTGSISIGRGLLDFNTEVAYRPSVYLPGKKNLVVFDIDGVIFNSEHRYRLYEEGLKTGDHKRYFERTMKDEVLPGAHIARLFFNNPTHHCIFVTGRGDDAVHRALTLCMLKQHVHPSIDDERLLMREYPLPEDYEHDTVKKPKMIEAAGYWLSDIYMVFEDRNSIVDMWRERGIITYHTQPGDF